MRGLLALLAGIVLFSTLEVTSKLMQIGGGIAGHYPFWLVAFRFIITGLVLLVPAVLQLRGKAFNRRDVAILTGMGLLGITLMSSLYHLSITVLPANIAALVFSCNPVFVILFAPLVLPEKITVRKLVAVGLCLIGIAVLAWNRATDISLTGLLLMMSASVIFALHTVLFKKITPRYGALPITAVTGLIGGLCVLPLAFGLEGMPLASFAMADWLGIAYLAFIGTALGYFLFLYGLGHVEAGTGSMAFFLKPFLAALFAWIGLHEKLTIPMLIGGALILGGMGVALVKFSRFGTRP
ncbi:MAG: EamA family transporter [Verrucomicrobia bacterium]|nr:EamA family transporter [Verrucomicrobiota bacterium]